MMGHCVEQPQRDGYRRWAVEVRTGVEFIGGEFIGFVALTVPTWEAAFTPCTEIGWRLARSGWVTAVRPRLQTQHWQRLSAQFGSTECLFRDDPQPAFAACDAAHRDDARPVRGLRPSSRG